MSFGKLARTIGKVGVESIPGGRVVTAAAEEVFGEKPEHQGNPTPQGQQNLDAYLIRFLETGRSTIGILNFEDVFTFSLEDPYQEVKVPGETRIPAGRYPLSLLTGTDMHTDYCRKYPHIHTADRGIIAINGVPNFTDIRMHIGNSADNTDGCVLTGESFSFANPDFIGSSREAYERLYIALYGALSVGHSVFLNVIDPSQWFETLTEQLTAVAPPPSPSPQPQESSVPVETPPADVLATGFYRLLKDVDLLKERVGIGQ